MIGIAEIGTAISGLKGALDIVKGLNAASGAVAVNDAKIALQSTIIEAQGSLLAAQETQAANLRRVEQLEQEIVRLKDWSAERERYHLVDIYRGSVAYMFQPEMDEGEPAHWLCANCFDQGKKSFLQFKGQGRTSGGRTDEATYGCDACKAAVTVGFRTKPSSSSQQGA
jgi:hypothetical protein